MMLNAPHHVSTKEATEPDQFAAEPPRQIFSRNFHQSTKFAAPMDELLKSVICAKNR